MPVGLLSVASYNIRGAHPEAEGATLEEALADLVNFWNSRPSLAVHEMGNLVITMMFGNQSVTLEITHPTVLEDLRGAAGPQAVLDHLARQTGLSLKDGRMLMEKAVQVQLRVDVLQVPWDPSAWTPAPGLDAGDVLQARSVGLVGALVQEADIAARRGHRRTRSPGEMTLIKALLSKAKTDGTSLAELAKASGIPHSTLKDAQDRVERERTRRKKQREKSKTEMAKDLAILKKAVQSEHKSVAEAAREAGVAPRTARDLLRREKEGHRIKAMKTMSKKQQSAKKSALLKKVRAGESATDAARALGIAERTARGWAKADLEERTGQRKA